MSESGSGGRYRFALIPAGLLIGVGIGLLAGNPGAGALIGLGLGFIGSSFGHPSEPAAGEGDGGGGTGSGTGSTDTFHWFIAAIGVLFVLLGIGNIVAPVNIWPYIGAVFLILLGIWIAAKEFGWRT